MENKELNKEAALKRFEEIIRHNHVGGYGANMWLQQMTMQYPCDFKNLIEKFYEGRMDKLSSRLRGAYHCSIEQINLLYTRLLLHICDPAFNDIQPDVELSEKLEPLLKQQNQQN